VKPTPAAQPQSLPWSRFLIPVCWMGAIYLASEQPRLPGPSGVPGFDKLAHFGAYGLMATLWVRALAVSLRPRTAACLAWLVASAFGVTDEFHQSFVPGRSAELADWVADSAGAAVAVVVYVGWPAYQRLLNHRLARHQPAGATMATAAGLTGEHP
jgi:VanZ family protein